MRGDASFRVPVARDPHGRLVAPDDATKRATYACPACASVVDLHAGEKKRRHFHHRTTTACSAESAAHRSAKELVVQAVADWRAGGDAPSFVRRCAAPECERSCRQAMPSKVVRAEQEHRVRSGHVVDVALLGVGDLVVAAVEIRHSHAVDDGKAFELGAPFVEVLADQVCETRGMLLDPIRDKFLPWLCAEHASARRAIARAPREDALRRAAALRALSFALGDFPGFHVHRIVRCANGHDAIVWTWDGAEPPWPRPPLVVARERPLDRHFSPMQGGWRALLPFRRTWVSTCATCGSDLSDS